MVKNMSESDKILDANPLDFEEYIVASEPHKRERAYAWRTAIGLQAVDGLQVSDYLKQTAQRNIEGEITIDEVRALVTTYYQSKAHREPDDDGKQEADCVAANITKLLGEDTFAFTVAGLTAIHRHIFDGVFKFAGQIRDYNITKKEWVLRGDTVLYVSAPDIRNAIAYDLQQEREFDYRPLPMDDVVKHISEFVAGVWQIHPFGEGNTRTTAVFTIKYLRSLGFEVKNDMFAEHSWYFRNALVRANYRNVAKGIDYDLSFLYRFFRNLLMGEQNELKNRYMLVNPPAEWKRMADAVQVPEQAPEQAPHKYPTSAPQVQDKLHTENLNIIRLIQVVGKKDLSLKEIMEGIGLKDRKNVLSLYLNPSISDGYVRLLYPDSPRHPRQKYLLTVKGIALYNELTNVENE